MIVAVTGAAGFIGSHVAERLSDRDDTEVLAVDDFVNGDVANLDGIETAELIDSAHLLQLLDDSEPTTIDAVVHLGAITDTTCDDQALLDHKNVQTTLRLAAACRALGVPLVYASSASVYGTSESSTELSTNEAPRNPYASSKLTVDDALRPVMSTATAHDPTLVGLRFFNVYGTRESHKGAMASIVHQAVEAIGRGEPVRLFDGCPDSPDGRITRDWVLVDDVVDVVCDFAFGPRRAGIFNVGTGQASTFEQVVALVIDALDGGTVEPIQFPDSLRGRYQYRTVADLTALRAAGCRTTFRPVEEGVPTVAARIAEGLTDG